MTSIAISRRQFRASDGGSVNRRYLSLIGYDEEQEHDHEQEGGGRSQIASLSWERQTFICSLALRELKRQRPNEESADYRHYRSGR
ncbi:MAG TPA: hypothetical protein VK208_15455 [Pyrinomonadaceae bacterium]|nr:hypothetical protein [Pyrinomonadaceae bacterium]